MTASRLELYNSALLICGERPLASLSEEREPRRLLDQAWDSDTLIGCLEAAQWNFAMRTVQIDHDPDYSPEFGYQFRFNKPTDWIATVGMCQDEFLRVPLLTYVDEVDFWYADITPIYTRFVSNDANYGTNYGKWPQTFADFVAAHLAGKIVLKLTTDNARRDYILHPRDGLEARRLLTAKSKDAMGQATQFWAQGRWVTARRTRGNSDLGSRSQLIG